MGQAAMLQASSFQAFRGPREKPWLVECLLSSPLLLLWQMSVYGSVLSQPSSHSNIQRGRRCCVPTPRRGRPGLSTILIVKGAMPDDEACAAYRRVVATEGIMHQASNLNAPRDDPRTGGLWD